MEPTYILRRHRRCRAPRLRATMRDGLVVTLPPRFPARLVPAILNDNREWVDTALNRLAVERIRIADELASFPTSLDLALTGERLCLVESATAGSPRAREVTGAVTLHGETIDDRYAALRAWLQRRARATLPAMLAEESERLGLAFARVAVRGQRTRWGSCSRAGTVSLNRALLMVDERLARYVLIHELVHTAHFDHSPAFWGAMEQYVPGARALDRELRAEWRQLPAWVRQS